MPVSRLLAVALWLAAAPALADGRLDTTFGQAGFAIEGFQPAPDGVEGANGDIALVACSGPLGSLIVSGFASGATRVVTMWLTPRGELDPRFSDDGKASFALPAGVVGTAVGACQPDGKPVIAYNLSARGAPPPAQHAIFVLRIGTQDGLPDPAFGGGSVHVPLVDRLEDSYIDSQVPLSVSMGLSGDLLLAGTYHRTPGSNKGNVRPTDHGFVARITTGGSVLHAMSSRSQLAAMTSYVTAAVGGDGRIRAAGAALDATGNPGAVGRSLLHYATLAPEESETWGAGLRVWPGRMLDGETMVLPATNGPEFPVLVFLEPDLRFSFPLPLPRVDLDGHRALVGLMQAVPLPDGKVVIAHGVARPGEYPRGFQVTRLRGVPSGDPKPDRAFGIGGSTLVLSPPGCGGAEVLAMSRFTFWNGAITAAATVNSGCSAGLDLDYAAVRLVGSVFADDFEARYPVR